MYQPSRSQTLPQADAARRERIVAGLAQPRLAASYPEPVMTLVLAIRLMAAAMRSGMDPVVELSRRLHSLTAAKAVLDLAKACSQAWPENVAVNRPCCQALSPDEAVFADMAAACLACDRDAFAATLDGLVRRERHHGLYAATTEAIGYLG